MIKPALGHLQVRKVRGPLLDLLYAQLKRCSDPLCTGKPFTEHRNVPTLTVDPASSQPAWKQVADTIGDAIRSGMLAAGEPLPSVREMNALQDIPVATLQHALAILADERLILVRQGRPAIVAGDASSGWRAGRVPRGRDHDCIHVTIQIGFRPGYGWHSGQPAEPKVTCLLGNSPYLAVSLGSYRVREGRISSVRPRLLP